MTDRLSILHKIANAEGERAREVRSWLSDEATISSVTPPVFIPVDRVFHLWRVRLRNSLRNGSGLMGAEALLESLEKLQPDALLEQFCFDSPSQAGNVFIDAETGTFVGAVTIATRAAENIEPVIDLAHVAS